MQAADFDTISDTTGEDAVALPLPQEEQARADIYGLIARLLLGKSVV